MTRDEFYIEYKKISERIIFLSEKARKEGLLELEQLIDHEKANNRDIFEYGLQFVVDGVDQPVVKRILSLIIEQEKDKYTRRLMELKKATILHIQNGLNTQLLKCLINAFTEIPRECDTIFENENDDEKRFALSYNEINALFPKES
ncbi:hypothetical protein [Treponema sp. R6D11]